MVSHDDLRSNMWFNALVWISPLFYSIVVITLLTTDQENSDHTVQSGYKSEQSELSGYSALELQALKKFRHLVSDIIDGNDFYKEDVYLLRWLRAKDFDVTAAHQMIRQVKQWRDENHIDTILDENIPFVVKPYTLDGFDKEGRPVLLFSPPKNDLRKLIVNGRRANALRAFDQMMEFGFTEAIKAITSRNGAQLVVILDFEGMNLRQHLCAMCMPVYTEPIHTLENYYPGSVKYFVMINVNKLAMTLVEFIKPLMSQTTRTSLKIFGTNKPEWQTFLLSIIDADQLTTYLGGEKTY